jgi:hypothetical protein
LLDRALRLVPQQCAQGALGVQGAVLVEAVVLDGDDRLKHQRADLLERDRGAVLLVQGGDQRAVGGQDLALLGQRLRLQVLRQELDGVVRLLGGDSGQAGEGKGQPCDECAAETTDQQEQNHRLNDVGPGRLASVHGPADYVRTGLSGTFS